ncbi:MAG: AraC family transcriptional regulator [Ruminococcaceae bacterium]|nr:AraC family transcriptional regulator [Oscillospiraceae bacterium]
MNSRFQKRIQDIAYAVGFQSFAYFSKCFKVQYGVSPLE